MNRAILALFSAQIGLSVFAQTDILPDPVMNILLQLPVVAILAYMTVYFLKWHEKMSDKKDEVHGRQIAALFEALNKFADAVSELDKQLALNTGTVNEAIRAHETVEDIKSILLESLGVVKND